MTDVLSVVLSVVAPVFVCAAVGYGWARSGRAYDRTSLTALISNIGAPCLVFRNLVGLAVDAGSMVEMAGAAVAAIATFTLLGAGVLRLSALPSHTYLAPLVFANTGNMGLAVSKLAFPGDGAGASPGLALAACYFAVTALLHFTVGIAFWSGTLRPADLLRTPLVWAVALAVVVLATGVTVPSWLLETAGLLGDFSIPLMLLTLGVALAELEVSDLWRSVGLSVLRLGMGVTVGAAIAEMLGMQGASRGVLILECSMPPAIFNVLFAEQYGRSPAQVASFVVVATLMSALTLPLVLAWVIAPG